MICRLWPRLTLYSAVLLLLCLPAGIGSRAAYALQAQTQILQELQKYVTARSVIDLSRAELMEFYPELKQLTFAESQEALEPLLEKVGEKVEAFFHDFPNTTSLEQVRRERMRSTGQLEARINEEYNYLLLARPHEGAIGLEEDRTGAGGGPPERRKMPGASFLTSGYASTSIFFHPLYRGGSRFRYLGMQAAKPRTYVIAFSQKPETRWSLSAFKVGDQSAFLLIQGLAWIDPASYQIVRLRTDLLMPRLDVGLNRQTTEIQFDEVRFENISRSIWLPKEVIVTIACQSQLYRNRHRYSHYRLFTVETQEKVEKPSVPP